MPDRCPFTEAWNHLPKGCRAPSPARGGPEHYQCTLTAGHREEKHALDVGGKLAYVSKRSPGRPPSKDPLSEVLWVRIPVATAKAIDELRGVRSRSDIVRELLNRALQRSA